MTPQIALAEGRLTDALKLQATLLASFPLDPVALLFRFEMLVLANQFREACSTLNAIDIPNPTWPKLRRWYRRLVRAANDRHRGRPAAFLGEIPSHAKCRRRAIRAIRRGDPADASRWIDRADHRSPHLLGHVDGREFDGLRDGDDRFASVLEAFVGATSVWIPFEQIRRVTVPVAEGLVETAYRPARIRLVDGREVSAVLPLVYPGSVEEVHVLGLETDHVNPDGGPVRCVGAKLLLVGEEELPLGEIRQLDVKAWA